MWAGGLGRSKSTLVAGQEALNTMFPSPTAAQLPWGSTPAAAGTQTVYLYLYPHYKSASSTGFLFRPSGPGRALLSPFLFTCSAADPKSSFRWTATRLSSELVPKWI